MSLLSPARTRYERRPVSDRWAEVHARSAALHDLLDDLARRGPRALREVRAPYADHLEQLVALHEHWSRRLHCRLDTALELGDAPRHAAVDAWRATDRDLPGVRAALDAHAHEDVVRRMGAADLRDLAVAAGLASWDDPRAARIGARLVA